MSGRALNITTKGRQKRSGVYRAKPAERPVGVGRGRHRLDGHWGRAKTIFDSELYKVLVAIINDAIGHASAAPLPAQRVDLEGELIRKGLTDRQAQVLSLHFDQRHSYRAIASILGLHHSTVEQHARAGEARLKLLPATPASLVSEGSTA